MNRWPIARYLLSTHYIFLIAILAAFYVACGVLLTVVALLTDIRISTVDVAAQVLIWLALGYGASSTQLLGSMLVHGRTRREFLVQYPVFVAISALTLAAMIGGVYAAEAAVYRAFDWGQKLQDHRMYESATDFPAVFVSYFCMLLTWILAGALLGAAFNRWEANAIAVVPPLAGLVLLSGGVTGFFSLVPALRPDTPQLGLTLAVTAGIVAVIWAMLWYTVRDMSLRVKAA